MKKFAMMIGAAASAASLSIVPVAQATTIHHVTPRHHYTGCENRRHHKIRHGTITGAGIGAVGGALIGHRNPVTGALIGAGVGAVAGHAVSSHNNRYRCGHR